MVADRVHCLLALTIAVSALAPLRGPAVAAPSSQDWITYKIQDADLAFDYPAAVFTEEKGDPTAALSGRTSQRAGRIFESADGQAVLQFGTLPNLDNLEVDQLRKRAASASYADADIEYSRATDSWYALSGTRGEETFYERVQFNCDGKRLDMFALTYPTREHRLYDAIVEEMSRRAKTRYAAIRCTAN